MNSLPIALVYAEIPAKIPVRRLLMLAPANYGSKLASMGQSMLGRVIKGWDNWFHTGKEMLNALEPLSPYLWELKVDPGGLKQWVRADTPTVETPG